MSCSAASLEHGSMMPNKISRCGVETYEFDTRQITLAGTVTAFDCKGRVVTMHSIKGLLQQFEFCYKGSAICSHSSCVKVS